MKLAEALLERSETQKRILDLQRRLQENAVVQQDDPPLEDPAVLYAELLKQYEALANWNRRINLTNNNTTFDGNLKICDALALRELLDKQIRELESVASHFVIKSNRYSKTEIKNVVTMNPKPIRDQVEKLRVERKGLDLKLKALNWNIELAE